ncbi:MAG: E2F-associated phosphoprotein-domain-containing protein [Benjaminiella poitrasii]|nr:MAG: E2F-associated phosphoprotein-domain-containing protein [Benjaminiella poitrasii]
MNTTQPTEEEYYSDTYFDTDLESDDELNTESRTKSKRKVPTNEELLYDPDMDDKDEAWVVKQINLDSSKKEEDVPLDEKTDAILSCPMCFTTLCYSCQRHERYKDQYRAMFVRNCQTIKNERRYDG